MRIFQNNKEHWNLQKRGLFWEWPHSSYSACTNQIQTTKDKLRSPLWKSHPLGAHSWRLWTTTIRHELCFLFYILSMNYSSSNLGCFLVVQPLGRVQLFLTPRTAARQASLASTISQSLLKLMSIKSVVPSNHLMPCRPLLLLPSIFPSVRAALAGCPGGFLQGEASP